MSPAFGIPRGAIFVTAVALCGMATVGAAEPKLTTASIHLGGPIAGPDVTADSLRGRVVLLELWGREIVDSAPAAREADPAGAMERLQVCAATFTGAALGKEAAQLTIAWRKDTAFQTALKCGRQLAQLEAHRSVLLAGGKVVTPDIAAALPAPTRRLMKDLADAVQKNALGSTMAQRAGEIAMEWNLEAAGK